MSAILPDVKLGDIGTTIELTVQEPVDPAVPEGAKQATDLSNYTIFQFEFERPRGKRNDKVTATIKNGAGTDGILTYTTTTAYFNLENRWKVRAILTTVSGNKFHGSWVGFSVSD